MLRSKFIYTYYYINWQLIRLLRIDVFQWRKELSGIRESNPPLRLGKPVHYRYANSAMEPIPGLEPGTYALRMRCSTNWAISAVLQMQRYCKKNKQPNFTSFLCSIFYCGWSNNKKIIQCSLQRSPIDNQGEMICTWWLYGANYQKLIYIKEELMLYEKWAETAPTITCRSCPAH